MCFFCLESTAINYGKEYGEDILNCRPVFLAFMETNNLSELAAKLPIERMYPWVSLVLAVRYWEVAVDPQRADEATHLLTIPCIKFALQTIEVVVRTHQPDFLILPSMPRTEWPTAYDSAVFDGFPERVIAEGWHTEAGPSLAETFLQFLLLFGVVRCSNREAYAKKILAAPVECNTDLVLLWLQRRALLFLYDLRGMDGLFELQVSFRPALQDFLLHGRKLSMKEKEILQKLTGRGS